MRLDPKTIKDNYRCPYDMWVEHMWWEPWWMCPYRVFINGAEGYTYYFRTKRVALWYADHMAKKLKRLEKEYWEGYDQTG